MLADFLGIVRFAAKEGFEDEDSLMIGRVETVVIRGAVFVPYSESFRVPFFSLCNFMHLRDLLRFLKHLLSCGTLSEGSGIDENAADRWLVNAAERR